MALKDSWVKKEFTVGDELEQRRQAALLEEMGLEDRDVNKLRSMMLDSNEAVAAKSEELRDIRQHKGRKKDWEEWIDVKRRLGRVLHHSEFILRLRSVMPNLLVYPGNVRGCLSLYNVVNTPVDEYPDFKLNADYRGPKQKYFDAPMYIGWIHSGEIPEYEIDIVNDVQVAIGQKRGWRTILLRMIIRWNIKKTPYGDPLKDMWGRNIRLSRASFITEDQALQAFGPPSAGETATAYRQQLHMFRNAHPQPCRIEAMAVDPYDPRGLLR